MDDEDELYDDLLAKSLPIPTELELSEAEARNLVQHEVRIGRRKQFNWEDCPVWQEERPPDHREPPWRIPGQRGAGYFQIDEIERFLLHGDY
jgi:hypothetical protein